MPCFKYASCFTPKEGIYQKAYKLTGNPRYKWDADKIRIFKYTQEIYFPMHFINYHHLPPKKTPTHQKVYPPPHLSNENIKAT